MSIFLIIIIILIACWPWISKWLQRYMARRAEDFLRHATGMPPRSGSKDEKRQQRTARQNAKSTANQANSSYSRRRRSQKRSYRDPNEPIIPPEYAEDVEFVETRSYSETTIGATERNTRQYSESQVSDVEYVEIKDKR